MSTKDFNLLRARYRHYFSGPYESIAVADGFDYPDDPPTQDQTTEAQTDKHLLHKDIGNIAVSAEALYRDSSI
jgi:hypothetical protein